MSPPTGPRDAPPGGGLILGRIAAVVFIFALASAGTTWIMGADRAEAVASFDGGGPRILGRFSARFGTPAGMNVLSRAGRDRPYVRQSPDHRGQFGQVLCRRTGADDLHHHDLVPVHLPGADKAQVLPTRCTAALPGAGWHGGSVDCRVVPTFWALLATVALIWPGFGVNWFGAGGNPNEQSRLRSASPVSGSSTSSARSCRCPSSS